MALLKNAMLVTARTPLRQTTCSLFGFTKKTKLPDDIEHATGLERFNLLLKERGIEDPYGTDKQYKRKAVSTEKDPNLVVSFLPSRMIGCLCEEDATVINYTWIHQDHAKRCECGHWFKAVPAPDYEAMLAEDMKWKPAPGDVKK